MNFPAAVRIACCNSRSDGIDLGRRFFLRGTIAVTRVQWLAAAIIPLDARRSGTPDLRWPQELQLANNLVFRIAVL